MSYIAEYPDGTTELLLSVPKYDFNWQFNYLLEEPVFLPAGTRLIARGAMDNSAQNPSNPDPAKPVHFGLQTMHEMFFGFFVSQSTGAAHAEKKQRCISQCENCQQMQNAQENPDIFGIL